MGLTPRNWTVQERLIDFCAKRGWTLAPMSIAFLLSRPQMATVIAGADRPEHVIEERQVPRRKVHARRPRRIDRLTLVEEDRTLAPIYQHTQGELHF